jgi:hypothetical protein
MEQRPGAKLRLSPVTALAGLMVVLTLGAWLGASLTTTPREAALKAEPPPPSVILAQIESRQVAQEIVTRGQVRADRSIEAIGPNTPAGAAVALISKPLPQRGDTFDAGDVAAEISGRPVLLLTGTVPLYRTLGPSYGRHCAPRGRRSTTPRAPSERRRLPPPRPSTEQPDTISRPTGSRWARSSSSRASPQR